MNKNLTLVAVAVIAGGLAGGAAWWSRGQLLEPKQPSTQEIQTEKIMYNCAMHPWIIKDKPGTCPICGMTLVPMKGHSHGEEAIAVSPRAIRIDPVVVQNIGVQTEPVEVRELSKEVQLSGRLAVDETRQVSVNAKIMGWVETLAADYLGKSVRAGEVLMELYSPDLLTTQEEYLQALRYLNGLQSTASATTRRGAQELVESARRRLEFWNIPASAIDRLAREGKARRTLPIVSPATGVLVAKNVMEGQNIMAGMELFRIADLSRIWVLGEVYQEDLAYVKMGQAAEIRLAYLPGKTFTGKVSFISPVLDAQSKTALVRVELQNNREMQLKPEMVADVRISFALGRAISIPHQSVIRTGKRNIAIVSLGNGYFEPREVLLGATAGKYVQVLEGLKAGDVLVISSQFLIDSESNLKSAVMGMSQPNQGAFSLPSAKKDAPDFFRKSLGHLFEAYALLQQALVIENFSQAMPAAQGLQQALDKVHSEGLQDSVVWLNGRKTLNATVATLLQSKKLDEMRLQFQNATNALVPLLQHYGYDSPQRAELFHCPMAMDGKGADWLQAGTELKNPYLGEAMLGCGEHRETL